MLKLNSAFLLILLLSFTGAQGSPVPEKVAESMYRDITSHMTHNVKITAIGEAVHLSDGFGWNRVAILRRLIERNGLREIYFENQWENLEALNQSIANASAHNVPTSAKDVSDLMSWALAGDPADQLVAYVQAWNRSHPTDLVRFEGFDPQYNDGSRLYLKNHFSDPSAPKEISAALSVSDGCLTGHYGDPITPAQMKARSICEEKFQVALDAVKMNRAYGAKIGSFAYANLISSLTTVVITQKLHFIAQTEGVGQSFTRTRDAGMRNLFNLRWTAHGRKQVAILSHNGHITRIPGALGSYLAADYGQQYFVVGQVAFEARSVADTYWNEPVSYITPIQCNNCLETKFKSAGQYYGFMDTRDAFFDVPRPTFALQNQLWCYRGKLEYCPFDEAKMTNDLRSQFDVFLYVEKSEPAHWPRP